MKADLTDRQVVVTGAGGFIGSHLVEALVAAGARVRALVHYNSRDDFGLLDDLPADRLERVEVIPGDIRDASQMRDLSRDAEYMFHLAALIGIPYSYVATSSYVETNIVGTLNILEACRDCGVGRLVHMSTSETYGTARYAPIDEEHPLQAQSPYAATKIGADKLVESYMASYGLSGTIVRSFNNYGPRQSARAVIPTIILQALTSDRIELGSLSPIRDFLYVADTTRALLLAATSEQADGRVVNVGSGRSSSIGEVASRILGLLGRDVAIVQRQDRVRPQDSEVERLECDASLAGDLFGWTSVTGFDEGLQRTIAAISENLDRYRADAYVI